MLYTIEKLSLPITKEDISSAVNLVADESLFPLKIISLGLLPKRENVALLNLINPSIFFPSLV